jgi:hypothetical protein
VALVVTVLLLAVAATIVLALAAEAITSSRTSASEANNAVAVNLTANAEAALTSALQNNPYFYLSGVFTDSVSGELYSENARVCLPTGALVEPGQAWSVSECGTTWAYSSPTTTPNASIEITSPSLSNPDLVVNIEGTAGGDSSAIQLSYHLVGPEHYTLWSSSNLDLTQLSSRASLSGSIYSSGEITPPTNSGLLSGAQLEAEQGFTTTPTDASVRYYAQNTTSATPPVEDIRDVAPEVLTTQSLQSSLGEIDTVSCQGATPWWNSATQEPSSLCLEGGASVPLNANTSVKIPTNVTAYLLIFNGAASSGPDTVSVYYSVSPIDADQNCQTTTCDFVTQGQADAGESPLTNPGILAYWTPNELGTFNLPADGLISTDQDTYLSACSSGDTASFAVLNATCPTLSGSAAGMLINDNITVVAGTATTPANVYVDGSIHVTTGDTFGVIASGSLYLPYWAHTPGATTETLDGSYVALGKGVDQGVSAIQSYPSAVGSDATNPDDTAGNLNLVGSLATPDLSLTLPFSYFANINLSSSSTLVTTAPPYYTNFNGTWDLAGTVTLDPATLVAPAAPGAVAATSGTGSAVVSWTSPGSSPGQYFLVTTNGSTQTCMTTSTSCTVEGLSTGTAYTFSVLTIDPPNASLASLASNSVTPS